MRTVEEDYRIKCLEKLKDSVKNWDVHRADNVEMSKEEGYLLWRLEVTINELKEFYERDK